MAGVACRRQPFCSVRTLVPLFVMALFLLMHVFKIWPLNDAPVKEDIYKIKNSNQKHLIPSGNHMRKIANIPDKIPGGKKIYIGDSVYYDHGDEGVEDTQKEEKGDTELQQHEEYKKIIEIKVEEIINKKTDIKIPSKDNTDKNKPRDETKPDQLKTVNKSSSKYVIGDDIPDVHVSETSCANLFEHHPSEIENAKSYQAKHPKVKIPDTTYINMTKDCDSFKTDRKYILKPLNEEEESFPIAFSIELFKDVEMVERLLRAIYRPQNFYCIHVDSKSPEAVHSAMKSIAGCFDNVFLASRAIDVQWAWFSVLEPDIVCMEDLWKRSKKWKYFINLTGQEFPLKTNWDLVKILKVFNGANSMEGTIRRRNHQRTSLVHNGFFPTSEKKEPPPHNIVLTKGSVHITVSRAFVDYILHDPIALDFREWVKNTGVPDETFFSSLNHNPQLKIPGSYLGDPETDQMSYPFVTRFKNWGDGPFNWPCEGQRVRMVCIFSVGDLQLLKSRTELFANKFYLDYEPLAYDCMEELHYSRIREELAGKQFSTEYYKGLSFVKNHI